MAKKVFVIEDDRDIRETIVYVLQEEGYEVIASENSKLLNTIDSQKPDIILLDLNLPDMHGEEVLRRLREMRGMDGVPVVVVSADANPGQIEHLKENGAH